MVSKKRLSMTALSFALGVAFYMYGVFLAFKLLTISSFIFWIIVVLTSIGGIGALACGYVFVVFLGGKLSLKLTELVSHLNRSQHIIEVAKDEPQAAENIITRHTLLIIIPSLIFILTVTLAWDVYNLHNDSTSIFHPILHALDVFSKPVGMSSIRYSIETIPVMMVLIAIAGFIPSMVLPYYRKFKITGINSGPFHTDYLFTVVGLVIGLGVVLTLTGFLYSTLWMSQGPRYYHYVIPAMIGLSLHFSIGAFLGRGKAEGMIETMLTKMRGNRVFWGVVRIQRMSIYDVPKD